MGRIRLALIPFIPLLLLWACSEQNVVQQNPHGSVPLDGHSTLAQQYGVQYCQSCHGTNFDGGSSGASCLTCHVNAPPFSIHPNEWAVVSDDHRDFARAYHWTTCANARCHGEDLRGEIIGQTGPSCFTDCHPDVTPVPHTAFLDPANHGLAGRDDPRYCFNCHGDLPYFFQGGFIVDPDNSEVQPADCSLCHINAEAHPNNWAGANFPTHRRMDISAIDTGCVICHEVSGLGDGIREGAPSCFSENFTNFGGIFNTCHAGGPGIVHLLGQLWLDKAEPGYHGLSPLTCSDCHDQGTDCETCHFGPTGARTPDSNIWTHGHPDHELRDAFENVCNTCHKLNRQYGHEPDASCHDCHDREPLGHVLGQPWLDKDDPEFHGDSSLDCSGCHDTTDSNGLCYECHFGPSGSKTPSSWSHDKDGHKTQEVCLATCNNCHATNRLYGNGPGACHDCHEPYPDD